MRVAVRLQSECAYNWLAHARIQLLQLTFLGLFVPVAKAAPPTVSVSQLQFTDEDLDTYELGGPVTWTVPADTSQVTHYDVVLARDSTGTGESQVGLGVSVSATQVTLPENTALVAYTHVLVFTANADGRQATPSAWPLSDYAASVSNVAFTDYDLDNREIGGPVTWNQPSDVSGVVNYVTYVATSNAGTTRSQLGIVVVGTNVFNIPLESSLGSWTKILVYTRSSLFEQTTPAFRSIADSTAVFTSLGFSDLDLDGGELGGYATWSVSGSMSLVAHYAVYLAESSTALNRRQQGDLVPVGTNNLLIPPDTPKQFYTHVVVYTKSLLAQSSGYGAIGVFDVSAKVSAIVFQDMDLDAAEFGGSITWAPPIAAGVVQHYFAYFALSTIGTGRSQAAEPAPNGQDYASCAENTSEANFTHVVVYTKSSLVEQTTPVGVTLSDSIRNVALVNFVDRDLDAGDLGGTIGWSPPSDASLVVHYSIYVAADAAGGSRSQVGSDVSLYTTSVLLSADFPRGSFSKVVVYTKSQMFEQTTPVATDASDTSASASQVAFLDLDLDSVDIGGELTHYSVYLAAAAAGSTLRCKQVAGEQ